jgi:hypothetical protein
MKEIASALVIVLLISVGCTGVEEPVAETATEPVETPGAAEVVSPPIGAEGMTVVLSDEHGEQREEIDISCYFSPASQLVAEHVITDPARIARVAIETLVYLDRHPDDIATQANLLSGLSVSLEDLRLTLAKIVLTEAEDRSANRPSRLLSSQWLEQEFRLLRWSPGTAGSCSDGEAQNLRITKYVVYTTSGQATRTDSYSCALYAVPDEEIHLTQEQADARKDQLQRYRYTKQQVLAGALDDQPVRPLVWLTRNGLEEALLEGTIIVEMTSGEQRMFNVHRNNGIAYDRSKKPRDQGRYWYFKEVDGVLGYGNDDKIAIQPGVTFAGDVRNLGLGKLIAIRYMEGNRQVLRLGILADTGGAFAANLSQLDYLAGFYPDKAAFREDMASFPDRAETYLLIARRPAPA